MLKLPKLLNFIKHLSKPFVDGQEKVLLNPKKHLVDIIDILSTINQQKKLNLLILKLLSLEFHHSLFMHEFHPENKLVIYPDKYNSCEINSQDTQLLQILEAEFTKKEKGSKPFWNDSSTALSKKLWLPILTDSPVLDSNCFSGSSLNLELNCHMSRNYLNPQNMNSSPISWKFLQSLQPDITVEENIKAENEIITTKKIRFFPNTEQKKLFNKCFSGHRFFYNKAIEEINHRFNKKKEEFNSFQHCIHCDQPKIDNTFTCKKHEKKQIPWKLDITLPSLRKSIMKSDKELKNTEDEWQTIIPYDTRQLAVKEAITAYHSAISLKKMGFIDNFTLKYKSRSGKQVFCVNSTALRKDWKIFVTRLGKNSKLRFKKRDRNKLKLLSKSIEDGTNTDFKILNDCGCYYILLNEKNKKEDKKKSIYHTISLDPGVRCFQTGYSPDGHTCKIGENQNEKIKKLYGKMDMLKSRRDQCLYKKRRYNLNKKYLKIEKKVRDIIYDLHNQTTSRLASEYENILLPEFSTSGMLKKKDLHSVTKRMMSTLSFYKFKEKLKWECYKKSKQLYIVTEEYTSKTCTNCGTIKNNLGGSKKYECNECGIKIERDYNGARNILLKNIGMG